RFRLRQIRPIPGVVQVDVQGDRLESRFLGPTEGRGHQKEQQNQQSSHVQTFSLQRIGPPAPSPPPSPRLLRRWMRITSGGLPSGPTSKRNSSPSQRTGKRASAPFKRVSGSAVTESEPSHVLREQSGWPAALHTR